MKKALLALIAACTAAACLGGCKACDGSKKENRYDGLNAMFALEYSSVRLVVNETFDEITLRSEYNLEYTANGATVSYSVERFSLLSFDGESALKEELKGTAVIADGVVVSVNGDDVNITADIVNTGINFKEEYFEKAEMTDKYFSADVKDAGAFMGSELKCTKMHVLANFDNFLRDMRITYTSNAGNAVEYLYKFTV